MSDMDTLYDVLLAGKTVSMDFQDKVSAESFRTAFFRFKRVREDRLVALGFLTPGDIDAFKFRYDEETKKASMSFIPKKRVREITFEILD